VLNKAAHTAHFMRWTRFARLWRRRYKSMIKFILVFIFVLSGCATQSKEISLWHKVPLPDDFAYGCEMPILCTSAAQRYVEAYELGWWSCMEKYSTNIDYQVTSDDLEGNGGPAFINGIPDGCHAAEKHIHNLIKEHGKAAVSTFLESIYGPIREANENPDL